MNYRYLPLVAALFTLTGCDQMQTALNPAQEAAVDTALSGKVIATVNGKPLTQEVLDVYNSQRAAKGIQPDPENPDAPLNELIALELMSQQAQQSGAADNPLVMATMNQLQRSTLAGAAVKAFMDGNQVSDETVKATYDERFGNPGTEYKARHVLLKTEEKAREVIKMLDDGGDFAEVAMENSTGPSALQGGDLGWFSAQQMVKPFSDAAAAMEPGSYSKDPVETQFGWHVILLEDTRDATPPPFDDIKERLRMQLANQQLQQHIEAVRGSANVEIK